MTAPRLRTIGKPLGRRRVKASDERGLGLPEFVVTMLLLGLVTTMVMTLVVTINRTFTRDRAATDSATVAAIGMNELTRVIRSGTEIKVQGQTLTDPVFVSVKNEDVVLYAFLDTTSTNPKPIKVRFSINTNRELVETRWAATETTVSGTRYWTFPAAAAPSSTRAVARRIMPWTAGEKYLFTYLKADGSALSPIPASPTTIELRGIVAVQLTLKVQADSTARAEPVTLQNAVGIPNLGISRVGP